MRIGPSLALPLSMKKSSSSAMSAADSGLSLSMAFRLSQHTPLGADLQHLADAQLVAAIRELRDDTKPPASRVHTARKAIKRVRAVLRLARAGLAKRRFRAHQQALRQAARGLSAARDAAVTLATFDRLVPADDPLALLRCDLLASADAFAADAHGEAPPALADAAVALVDLRSAVLADLGDLDFVQIAAGLQDSYSRGRHAMRAAYQAAPRDDELFHAWRKRAKDLWYHCQLFRGACPPLLGALETMLDGLCERLGDDHDLTVLRAAIPANAALHQRIATRHAKLRDAAWRRGQRIYAERPRAFVRRLRVYWQCWRAEVA